MDCEKKVKQSTYTARNKRFYEKHKKKLNKKMTIYMRTYNKSIKYPDFLNVEYEDSLPPVLEGY